MPIKDEVVEVAFYSLGEFHSDMDMSVKDVAQAVINAYLKSVWKPIEEAPKDGTLIIIEGGTCQWSPSHAAWFSHQAQAPIQWEVKEYLDPADILPEREL